jgi:hypothetical protein
MFGSHQRVGTAKGVRRFFQFGLRTLLIAMTVFSVWLGIYVHRVRQQKAAVKAIREYGGWVHYDFQEAPPQSLKFDAQAEPKLPAWLVQALGDDFFFDVIEVNLVYNDDSGKREDNRNISGDVLRHLQALPELRQLLLYKGQATDEGLKFVGAQTKLERILMWDASEVTDAGVAHLASLVSLKKIHLSNSRITDDSLRTLALLPALETMSLQGNRFTNAGLAHLKGNDRLRALWLGLGDTHITDAGMPYLAYLRNLEQLDLQKTKVTSKGLAHLTRLKKLTWLLLTGGGGVDTRDFERALPNCKVQR